MTLKFKTKYDLIGNKVDIDYSKEPSLTDESYKKECDIDFIISNFVQKGIEPPEHQIDYGKQFTYDDFTKALDTVTEVKSAYECLPSSDKERFNNSVQNYLEFISNPDNLRESYEKGYINPASVDLSDVYPDRFNNDVSQANSSNSGKSKETSQSVDTTVSETVSENPTKS